jgi:hypothetical protein
MLSDFDPWAVLTEIRGSDSEGPHRAKAAKAANLGTVPSPDGLSVLGRTPRRRGLTLHHPWHGSTVVCPRGVGRFLWTDGYRCAVGCDRAAWLVDLDEVRPVGETDPSS